jgi:DNA-directed RNA polymerase beta subunit
MLNPNAKIIEPKGVRLRDPEDFSTLRDDIYNDALTAVEKSFPQKYGSIVMRVSDLRYVDPPTFTKKYEKEAIAKDQYLGRKLKGKISLLDKEGNLLDEKDTTLMRVPYLTDRGTFIHGGNDYGSLMQTRLIPGVYTRRQENGNLETQVNTRPGAGSSFRIGFEADTGQYNIKVRSANIHLYSLMKDMGVDEDVMKKTWGEQLYAKNAANYDPTAINRAYEKAVPAYQKKAAGDSPDKGKMLREFFDKVQVHEHVTRNNLPYKFDLEKAAQVNAIEICNEAMLPSFAPSLSAETAMDLYFARNPQTLELLKEASEFTPVPSHLKWLSWYKNFEEGQTSPYDEENKLAWRKAAAHYSPLDPSDPEVLLGAASWAIDLSGSDEADKEKNIVNALNYLEINKAQDTILKEANFTGSTFHEIINLIDND